MKSLNYLTLCDTQRVVGEWHEETFPDCEPVQIVEKAREEFSEWLDDINDPREIADIILVLLAFAHRQGLNVEVAMRDKFRRNQALTREDWARRAEARTR